MQVSYQCLRKIFVVAAIVFSSAVVFPTKAFAQTVDTTYALRISILPDTSVEINLQTDIFNKTNEIISKYSISLPFTKPQELAVTRDGNAIGAKVESDQRIDIDFGGSALRPQQTATIGIKYKLPNKLSVHDGIYTLLVPRFAPGAGENASYSVTMSYPEDFPPLLYQPPSVVQDGPREFKGTNPRSLIFIWGKEVRVGIWEDFPVDFASSEGTLGQVNLFPDYIHQDVYYHEIATGGVLAHQQNDNLWFLMNKRGVFSYKGTVVLRQLENAENFTGFNYGKFSSKKDLGAIESQGEKVQALYDEVVEQLNPAPQSQTTQESSLDKLGERVEANEQLLTNLEYALYMAGLLEDSGLPVRIVYGYLFDLDELPNFNAMLPHVWVETVLETRLITLDPYLEDLTGYSFYNTTRLNRLQAGVWDRDYKPDKILGILSETMRRRPEVIPPQRDIAIGSINMSAENFPLATTTATLFSGDLIVRNQTARVLAVDKLSWDGVDITSQVLRVNNDLTRAIRPQTTETLSAGPLILPNLVYDGVINHVFTLNPAQQTNASEVTTEVSIRYSTNTRVVFFVVIGVVLVGLLSFAVLFRRQWLLKQWRLYLISRGRS